MDIAARETAAAAPTAADASGAAPTAADASWAAAAAAANEAATTQQSDCLHWARWVRNSRAQPGRAAIRNK